MPKHRPNIIKHKVTVISASKGGRLKRNNVLFKDLFSSSSKAIKSKPQQQQELEAQPMSSSIGSSSTFMEEELVNTRSYATRKAKQCDAWVEKRSAFENAFLESSAPHLPCISCGTTDGDGVLCLDCGPQVVRCIDCTIRCHSESNHLHKPQRILDGILQPFPLQPTLSVRDHCCECRSRKTIQVFDERGRIHNCWLLTCSCEEESVTLIRLKLWPATPEQPRVAFHFELMSLLHFLLLEGHMSLKAGCQSLGWRNGLLSHEVNLLYQNLVGECSAEYRYFRHRCHNLNAVMDEDIRCPACPKENDDLFVSMDANFGLVRKRSSGCSYVQPNYKELLFASQEDVDNFVKKYNDSDIPNDCSHFQAGDVLRAKNKTKKLDTTGVFGAACRHGFPLCFLNLRHGERLAYAAYVIDVIQERVSPSVKLHFIYDIACKLSAHFKKKKDPKHELDMALPVFHAYGHQMSCQVVYSTRWRSGYGLTDGEVMERLWSYLRRFSSITKEMTPSHREDLLTDALLHYSHRKGADIGTSLVVLMDRAVKVQDDSKKALQDICSDCSVSLTDVHEWRESECAQAQKTKPSRKGKLPWQEKYVSKLQHYEQRRELLALCDNDSRAGILAGQCQDLDKELQHIEEHHGMQRWSKDHERYKEHFNNITEKQQQCLVQKMWSHAVEYSFFRDMSKKYSDGQAVATRISKSIRNSSKALRKLLTIFNSSDQCNPQPPAIYKDIIDPTSKFYAKLSAQDDHSLLPSSTKRKAVDLLNLCDRSNEEIKLVGKEMKHALTTAANEHHKYRLQFIEFQSHQSERAKGLVFLLGTYLSRTTTRYSDLLNSFSKFLSPSDIPLFPEHTFPTSPSDNVNTNIHSVLDYSSSDDSDEESIE